MQPGTKQLFTEEMNIKTLRNDITTSIRVLQKKSINSNTNIFPKKYHIPITPSPKKLSLGTDNSYISVPKVHFIFYMTLYRIFLKHVGQV